MKFQLKFPHNNNKGHNFSCTHISSWSSSHTSCSSLSRSSSQNSASNDRGFGNSVWDAMQVLLPYLKMISKITQAHRKAFTEQFQHLRNNNLGNSVSNSWLMTILQKIGFMRLQVGSQNVCIVAANQQTITALYDVSKVCQFLQDFHYYLQNGQDT